MKKVQSTEVKSAAPLKDGNSTLNTQNEQEVVLPCVHWERESWASKAGVMLDDCGGSKLLLSATCDVLEVPAMPTKQGRTDLD